MEEFNINTPLRLLANKNMDVFRYGLFKYDESQFEDPTYLGFTIEIDEMSSLFTQVKPFLEKQIDRTELASRIPIYDEFVSKILYIFKSQESVTGNDNSSLFIKSHYINNISGFQFLTKKFTTYKEDKLTVELYEDISMFSTYLATLYNNLIYSYQNGRSLIPENLLKFNLNIKISEIRDFTSLAKLRSNNLTDKQIVNALKNNVTCLIYKLTDCEFDFFNSKPIPDDVTVAGIDTPMPQVSVTDFEIYYKSVSRHIYTPLIKNALSMNDQKIDLGVLLVGRNGQANSSGQLINGVNTIINDDGEAFQQLSVDAISQSPLGVFTNGYKKPSDINTYENETENNEDLIEPNDLLKREEYINDMQRFNRGLKPFDPGDNDAFDLTNAPLNINPDDPGLFDSGGLENLFNKTKEKVKNSVNRQLLQVQNDLKRKRNELVRNFVNDLQINVGIKKIIPDNVYENPDYFRNALDQLKSDIGGNLGDALIDGLTKN
jgi:hypothetical protein